MIIDEVFCGLAGKDPSIKVSNIPVIKFLKPLKPDIVGRVNVSEMKPGLLQIMLYQNELLIVSGQLRVVQGEDK